MGLAAQGLREVPQRFAYVQPLGLAVGLATAGVEFAVGTRTSIELGGVGVYSVEDGVKIFGAGPGLGIRRYFGEGELAGVVMGLRADATWLTADNSNADADFLRSGTFETRRSDFYLGMGATLGYRWVPQSSFFLEPVIGYEFFAGPKPLVPGSGTLQNRLGPIIGVAFGLAI
jgi:hypothetical protein